MLMSKRTASGVVGDTLLIRSVSSIHFAILILIISACGSTVQSSTTTERADVSDGEFAAVPDDQLSVEDGKRPLPQRTNSDRESPGEVELDTIRERLATESSVPDNLISSQPSKAKDALAGRGFNSQEIFVGFATSKGAEDVFKSAGGNIETGDQEGQINALVAEINRSGGVSGRELVPVFYDFDIGRASANASAEAQRACVRWTEDHPVFAVINTISISRAEMWKCLTRRETPLLDIAGLNQPKSLYAALSPYFYVPDNATMERFVPAWIRSLIRLDYFVDGWEIDGTSPGREPTNIGVLGRGEEGEHFIKLVRSELAKHSKRMTESFVISDQSSEQAQRDARLAVLRFRQSGVTHVIPSLTEILQFGPHAESQNYRPRYALASHGLLNVIKGIVPQRQFVGSIGTGWRPTTDVDNAQDPSNSPAFRQCKKTAEDAGHNMSKRAALMLVVRTCDGLTFLQTAIKKGGLSATGFLRGAAVLNRLPSANIFRMSFSGSRPDGLAAFRDIKFEGDCTCFKYIDEINHGL